MGGVSIRIAVLALALGLAVPPDPAPAQSAAERREQLAQIRERMSDPDPLMRLAYLEEYAEAKDQTVTMLAVRYALSSDDPDLRATALRLYVASLESLDLEVELPDAFHAAYPPDSTDERVLEAKEREPIFAFVYGAKVIRLKVTNFDFGSGRLEVAAMNGLSELDQQFSGEGQVRGTTLTVNARVQLSGGGRSFEPRCSFMLRPGSDLVLSGEAACQTGPTYPNAKVSMPMF